MTSIKPGVVRDEAQDTGTTIADKMADAKSKMADGAAHMTDSIPPQMVEKFVEIKSTVRRNMGGLLTIAGITAFVLLIVKQRREARRPLQASRRHVRRAARRASRRGK
jgi:hypothetical protein